MTEEVTMSTDAQISREYHETKQSLMLAMAQARVDHPEWNALPDDVRESHVGLACQEEIKRHEQAVVAFDEMKLGREDRWISAHEYIKNLRTDYAQ